MAALVDMPLAQLHEKWAGLADGPVPNMPTALLRRMVAHRLQERRFGKLSPGVARELERAVGDGIPAPEARQAVTLTPGTRLIREWNGRIIAVDVCDGGFVWEDRTYLSLSQIAREVTGAHWSGPRFFGLTRNG